MLRSSKISEQDSLKNKNEENINLMREINDFDRKYNSKQEQLYANSYSSQMATKMNFIKKKNNQSPFVQGIGINHGYGVNNLKKNSINHQIILSQQKFSIEDYESTNLKTQQSATIDDDDDSQKQFGSNISSQYGVNQSDNTGTLQESNHFLINFENNHESNPETCNSERFNDNNASQKRDFEALSSSNNELAEYNTLNQMNQESAKSTFVVDLNSSLYDKQKQNYSFVNQRICNPNSFRGSKNQQETADKIKRIRLRSHQSAMRAPNTQQQNNLLNSGGNNFVKLLKIAEGEVKEKSKQAIESIKNKLAINSENESVLVLKTQPQTQNDENLQIHSGNHQQNLSYINFNKKKNSCVLNDSSLPFQPISQNVNKPSQNQFMNRTHTSGFCAGNDKQIKNSHHFQLTSFEQTAKPSISINIQSLCITPNKSFYGKSVNKSMNKSIENGYISKSDNKSSQITDENRRSLYKRIQNCNTFMRGKFAFHKLNKQKKQLSNISNVLYNGLLENYEVEGMLKTYNPSLKIAQPKKRFYDAEEENEEIDSPDFNHMRKYYNNKYGLKLQQLENEKSEKINSEVKNRIPLSSAQTPVRRNKEVSSSKKNVKNNSSLIASANQKYYSQSATTHNDNKLSQNYTENLLNESCTDFLNLCNPLEISSIYLNQNIPIQEFDSSDNTSSSQSSKQNQNTSYNLQNFTQYAASAQTQSKSQSRKLKSGASKTRKKNDIEIQPWGDDISPLTKI